MANMKIFHRLIVNYAQINVKHALTINLHAYLVMFQQKELNYITIVKIIAVYKNVHQIIIMKIKIILVLYVTKLA
jgi:hypothetical protein